MTSKQKRVLGRVLASEEVNAVAGGTTPGGEQSSPIMETPAGCFDVVMIETSGVYDCSSSWDDHGNPGNSGWFGDGFGPWEDPNPYHGAP